MSGTGACFSDSINNGQLFALQNVYSQMLLSARQNLSLSPSPAIQESTVLSDPNVQFTYTSARQIVNPNSQLCLDDMGNGYSTADSTNNILAFTLCKTPPSYTQQFAHSPDYLWVVNPNNLYDKCLDGNYAFPHIFLYTCPYGASDHQWNVVLVCPPGFVSCVLSASSV